jgi:signal transduction histidine kinase
MTTRAQKLIAAFTRPPDLENVGVDRLVMWAGLLASGLPCALLLVIAIARGSPTMSDRAVYAALVLSYLGLLLLIDVPSRISRWLWRRLWAFLLAIGLVCMTIQSLVDESFLQPIIFLVPLIYAALIYPPGRVAAVGLSFLGLMNLGIWLSGQREPSAFLFPTFGYGTFMIFTYAFVQLSIQQAAARREADRLTADVARQRDYLARLVEITATLTRDLDLTTVLEQVAAAGRTLAHAAQARVWLREDDGADMDERVRLAAGVPAQNPAQLSTTTELWGVASIERLASEASGARLVLPLVSKGATIGALELHDPAGAPFSAGDALLLQPFADAAAVAIENARLYEQSRLSATLSERNRLARELHDTIAQGLTAVTMQLEAAQRGFERDPARARTRVARAHELARETLEDVRRSVWTLAAPLIDGQALSDALKELVERFAARTGLPASYRHSGPPPALGHAAATQVLRIVQEALQNVEKHAQAAAVTVGSKTGDGALRVWVGDDGVGFAPGAPPANGNGDGFGLLSLRERARLAGGTLQVESTPGEGTRVTVTIPNAHRET